MGLDYSLFLTHEYAAFDIKRPTDLQDKLKSSLRTPFEEDIGNLCSIGLELEESRYVKWSISIFVFLPFTLTHCDQTTSKTPLVEAGYSLTVLNLRST